MAVDAETVRDAMDDLGGVLGVSDEDFASQFGYGVSTQFDNPGFAPVFGERNVQALEDLPAADQVAYTRALLGEDAEATFVFTLEVEDFSRTGGCTRTAIERFFSSAELSPSYVNPIDVRVQQDARLLAAQEQWSGCMREAGFDYESSEDTDTDVQNRLEALTEGADPETLTGRARDALVELQGYERALAVADNRVLRGVRRGSRRGSGERGHGCAAQVGPRSGGWSGRWDSNPRPSAWKADALPLSYSRSVLRPARASHQIAVDARALAKPRLGKPADPGQRARPR